jgi:plastocyanin
VKWQWQTGFAGGSGPSSSYELDRDQYVVVSAGPVLWAFKLGGTLSPADRPHISTARNDDFSGPVEDANQVETVSLQRDIDTTGNRYFVDEYSFNPYRIRVAMTNGEARVTWVNNGRMVHTISAVDNSWTTGALNPAAQASVTFHQPGNYTYICKDHPWSYGQIIVTAAAHAQATSVAKADNPGAAETFQLQASRGKDEYDKNCSSCHGQDLGGRDPAPALTGETFAAHWTGRSANDLFGKTHSTMPQNKPDSLPRQEYLDIVAFMLKSNNISVGDAALADNEEALKKIKLAKP